MDSMDVPSGSVPRQSILTPHIGDVEPLYESSLTLLEGNSAAHRGVEVKLSKRNRIRAQMSDMQHEARDRTPRIVESGRTNWLWRKKNATGTPHNSNSRSSLI